MKFHGRQIPEVLQSLGIGTAYNDEVYLEAETPYEAWHLSQLEEPSKMQSVRVFVSEEKGYVIAQMRVR